MFKNNKNYYETSGFVTDTFLKLIPIFGHHNRPNKATIQRLVTKFETTFSIHNIVTETRQIISRNVENIDAVRQSVFDDPNVSILHRSLQLRMSRTTVVNSL